MTRAHGAPAPTAASPIGVFDSGIGGLTVVRELIRRLPHERIIYFGDTARLPYGPKSPETVRRYSREITSWLLEQGVKVVVVACNTATAHALPALRAEFPVPVIGVAEPGAQAAVRATHSGRVGVIGTAGTVSSGAYDRAIHALRPDAVVTSCACPLFVPLVEEGWLDTQATRLIAREYLESLHEARVDTAAETARVLAAAGLCASDGPGDHRFVASDAPEQFLRLGQRFLGSAIEHVETLTLG